MAIVDDRGRLFGRMNLIDLAVVVLIAALIPLGYAAYLLFREQPPRLVSVSPTRVEQAPEIHLQITGEHLRPYMRISAGTQQAREFVFKSTEEAEVPFAGLPPGTYDIVLYDQARERFRLPQALTVSPSSLPSTEMVAIGAFGNLDATSAAQLTAGTKLAGVGEIVAVGKPTPDLTEVFSAAKVVAVPMRDALRLPAVVKFACHINIQQGTPYCAVDNVVLAPRALLTLPTPLGKTPFQIQRVRSFHPVETVSVAVNFRGHPSVLSQVKPGDRDTGGIDDELGVLARVDSIGPVRVSGESSGEVSVRLTANVQRVESGLVYDSAPLRLGGVLTLRTSRYEVAGIVTAITAQK